MLQRISEEAYSSSVLQDAGTRILEVGRGNPIRICAGHRIRHHDGKCSQPHGHNYEISVELAGTVTEEGWIVDKGDVTELIDMWDHKFLVERGDPLIEAFEHSGDADALVVLEHPPTAEVISIILERRLIDGLPNNVSNVDVTVRETGELCVTQ